MLRRVKRDVENEMPPKTEVEVPCELTPRQRLLYNGIKANISVDELLQSVGGNNKGGANGAGDEKGQLMNLVMQLRKVCNHPETFERRNAQTPFQFEDPPPPSHVPLPPSILASSSAPTALDVTLVTRAAFDLTLPRLLLELADEFRHRQWLHFVKMGLWSRPNVLDFVSQGGLTNSGWSCFRLGISGNPGDIVAAACPRSVMSCWTSVFEETERGRRILQVYGTASEIEERRFASTALGMLRLPQRFMAAPVVLTGHQSPSDMVEVQSRMLNAVSVYIPPAAAPPVEEYYPGLPGRVASTLELESLPYPAPPLTNSPETTQDYYSLWRTLLSWADGRKATFPIALPHAGRLVADSGKMKTLDALLRRLKKEGHKCLVYSQFTRVMDILEDYCGKTGYKFLRLDGQSALADRRDMVADWQTNDELFVFLLSTRAGGVGINLTAADTVIFYDSDWNPTVDAQAMDRAHRLGQERPVTVYRLVSRGTIEERIRARAKQKDRIHELVIRSGGEDLEVDSKEEELGDLATLLLGEEDIGMKAQLAGGVNVGAVRDVTGNSMSVD
eukprot:Plantae.Rhodophyta-Rhodochaete_pulchella.ctg8091.p1 GENE.Plantae.Rhodophyta-Rhodochaete_pulchella.ctg8091~~Plantae.Rhodophyta-Rhodochaete_pulchella.ctg8091.p1  ORF type:complete len:617 (+),score=96.82 Plantae.Rhodophyta-Rhodochaete_pulchella.ctg8091:172-1851(+)